MNNTMPFIFPYNFPSQNSINQINIDKIYNKLDKIENKINRIENKLNLNKENNIDDNEKEIPTDMYII